MAIQMECACSYLKLLCFTAIKTGAGNRKTFKQVGLFLKVEASAYPYNNLPIIHKVRARCWLVRSIHKSQWTSWILWLFNTFHSQALKLYFLCVFSFFLILSVTANIPLPDIFWDQNINCRSCWAQVFRDNFSNSVGLFSMVSCNWYLLQLTGRF